ncbi:sulfotransferase family protein [Aurantivibrio plasticivorans]
MADIRPKPTLLYIVGMGHSGSTLLELLLNRVDNVASMGEISLFSLQLYRDEKTRWVGQCSCGQRPNRCPRWGSVIKAINEKNQTDLMASPFSWTVSDLGLEEEFGKQKLFTYFKYKATRFLRSSAYKNRSRLRVVFDLFTRSRIERRDDLIDFYAEDAGVDFVVDASKDPIEMRDIVEFSRLNPKVIFLTRNPMGLAWSSLRNKNQSVDVTAKTWVRLNERILDLLNDVPKSQWIHVEYEELCRDPELVLEKVAEFAGVSPFRLTTPDDEFLKRHTIAGNKHRFKKLAEVREDLEWKEKLTLEQQKRVKTIVDPLFIRLNS